MARRILESNPYEKKVFLTDLECSWLMDDATPCTFCDTVDTNKTHENVGQIQWREPYTSDNVIALCRLCFKVRRGRSFSELCSYAIKVLRHLRKTYGGTDLERLLEAARRIQQRTCANALSRGNQSARSNVLSTTIRTSGRHYNYQDDENISNYETILAVDGNDAPLRQRYAAYVGRQNMHPPDSKTRRRSCAWGELGDPRRQGGRTEEGRRLTYRCFCALMHVRACFYCGVLLRASNTRSNRARGQKNKNENDINNHVDATSTSKLATLDRISSAACYSPRNVVVVCGSCNQTKSRLEMSDFVTHLEKLEAACVRKKKRT